MGRLVIIFLFFVFKAFSTGLDSTEVVFKDNEAIIKKDSLWLLSSEIKEVLAVADRVLILAKGKITKELNNLDITEDNLVKFSQG